MVIKPNITDHHKDTFTLEGYWALWKLMSIYPRRIMELGIYTGGSLLLWNDMFAPDVLVGLDIDIDRAGLERVRQFDNICLCTFDQYDPNTLVSVMNELDGGVTMGGVSISIANFDLIIDDCSHDIEGAFGCMDLLWPRLNVGGAYVIEDWNAEWVAEAKLRESLNRSYIPQLNMGSVIITPGFIGMVKCG